MAAELTGQKECAHMTATKRRALLFSIVCASSPAQSVDKGARSLCDLNEERPMIPPVRVCVLLRLYKTQPRREHEQREKPWVSQSRLVSPVANPEGVDLGGDTQDCGLSGRALSASTYRERLPRCARRYVLAHKVWAITS